MKKIYYLQKHEVKLGDVIEYNGIKATVTEELIELNPELFIVKDTMQELLDKAKRDYPAGTVFRGLFGKIWTVKNKPCYSLGAYGSILIDDTYVYRDGRWAKVLPLKFITEDGVGIYGDMKTYLVHPNDSIDICLSHSSWYGDSECKDYKYFYSKENAIAYIEKYKEKTLRDYENMLFERGNSVMSSSGSMYFSVYGWLKDTEPKLYYTKVLQLIADDLNDGRYIHIRGNTSYHLSNAREVNVHCGGDEGCVYFKSRELVEKARVILGDKVNYLFK